MVKSKQSTDVLKLGKKIVQELELSDRGGILNKWMAHYIAELMESIEKSTSATEKKELQKECFDTILNLWKNRKDFSEDINLLSSLKPAILALSKLKKEEDIWHRTRTMAQTSWESLAINLHDNFMSAMKICVQVSIAEDALGKEKVWLEEYSEFLSKEEKEVLEKLEYFLIDSNPKFTFVVERLDEEKESEKSEKNRMERALDRLDEIVNSQRELVEKLKKECLNK